MKIYCIKIDAMPFIPGCFEIKKLVKGSMSRQVGGCFTTTTLIQMLIGKLSSDLHPHGIGYTTGQEKHCCRDGAIDWPWIKECIFFSLKDRGYKIFGRNVGVVSGILGLIRHPEIYSDSYSPSIVKNKNALGGIVDKYIRAGAWVKSIAPDRFTLEEEKYIERAQASSDKNVFHFFDYNFFHRAGEASWDEHSLRVKQEEAVPKLIKMLSNFDFTEENALFWIFSDHGFWLHPKLKGYPFVQNFYTWAILRDNTDCQTVQTLPKVISALDFNLLIRHKVEGSEFPTKRDIFFTEDGRADINPKKSTSALVCQFVDYPTQMTYLIYHEPDNRFLQRIAVFDKDGLLCSEKECNVDTVLKEKLNKRFDWVKI